MSVDIDSDANTVWDRHVYAQTRAEERAGTNRKRMRNKQRAGSAISDAAPGKMHAE